ncbi:MAG: uroporphyrinogen-III synthase, partial [Acidobacteriota bacterium]
NEVRDSLARHAALASVGPIMTAALESAGLTADIIPLHPKMAGLVKAAAEQAGSVLEEKRAWVPRP